MVNAFFSFFFFFCFPFQKDEGCKDTKRGPDLGKSEAKTFEVLSLDANEPLCNSATKYKHKQKGCAVLGKNALSEGNVRVRAERWSGNKRGGRWWKGRWQRNERRSDS